MLRLSKHSEPFLNNPLVVVVGKQGVYRRHWVASCVIARPAPPRWPSPILLQWHHDPSGSGMNSASPGTGAKRPAFQSTFARSMRSRELETKFHQR